MSRPSTSEEGALDLDQIKQRRQEEQQAYTKVDGRIRKNRVNRTELISFRIKPGVDAKMVAMKDAENTSMVEIVERGILLHDAMKGGEEAKKLLDLIYAKHKE